jgi:hypothetical protein
MLLRLETCGHRGQPEMSLHGPARRLVLQAPIRPRRVPLDRRKGAVAVDYRGFGGVLLATVTLLGAVSVSACGEVERTKTVTVTAPAGETAPTPDASPKQDAEGGRPTPTRPKTVLIACDANVRAKAGTTTCGFAENVFYEYWRWREYAEVTDIAAFSPALKVFLRVDCNEGDAVVCRTSAGAFVRFPLKAVKAYTLENAAQYARRHNVSKGPNPTSKPPASPSENGSDCDPNYEGACLDPNSSDYDCEGGSGDGPDYTGTVTVVGDDHFGLDRDGDGVGCDS